jgi:hypothetical protein
MICRGTLLSYGASGLLGKKSPRSEVSPGSSGAISTSVKIYLQLMVMGLQTLSYKYGMLTTLTLKL